MLDCAYQGFLSRLAVTQATSRDPPLFQVVKAVFRGEDLPQIQDFSPYSHKSVERSLQEGCLPWSSRVVIPRSLHSKMLQLLHAGHPRVANMKLVARL